MQRKDSAERGARGGGRAVARAPHKNRKHRDEQAVGEKGELLLEVKDLRVEYTLNKRRVYAVNGVSFTIRRGEALGIVGESGCGKSTIAKAILRILPDRGARIAGGEVLFHGRDLTGLPDRQMDRIRGDEIAMIFQDPMTALNPVKRVLTQVSSVIRLHLRGVGKAEANERAIRTLGRVGISPDRVRDYPHQFSGGMQQRVETAIGIACHPELLLADEPTTALDVTIQAQVLDMLSRLMKKNNTALLLITHNLGVVAEICDNVAVLYGGEIMEYGSKREIFKNPAHPYTIGLFGALPDVRFAGKRLKPIDGIMPEPSELPPGCKFHTRCPYVAEVCRNGPVPVVDLGGAHSCRCHNPGAARGAKDAYAG
jgi:peptide/nickel transport system ATP-binding protein